MTDERQLDRYINIRLAALGHADQPSDRGSIPVRVRGTAGAQCAPEEPASARPAVLRATAGSRPSWIVTLLTCAQTGRLGCRRERLSPHRPAWPEGCRSRRTPNRSFPPKSPRIAYPRVCCTTLRAIAGPRKGVFHIAEGGLPIPADKPAVPKHAFAALLAAALRST